jgi:hypothetical protein
MPGADLLRLAEQLLRANAVQNSLPGYSRLQISLTIGCLWYEVSVS